jgi:hypothetical protein
MGNLPGGAVLTGDAVRADATKALGGKESKMVIKSAMSYPRRVLATGENSPAAHNERWK